MDRCALVGLFSANKKSVTNPLETHASSADRCQHSAVATNCTGTPASTRSLRCVTTPLAYYQVCMVSTQTCRHQPTRELPDEALDLVLQRVPLRSRQLCCALVCTSWPSAVAAIPVHASTTIDAAGGRTALQESLNLCGSVNGQLVSLSVFNSSCYYDPLLQLPGCKLRHLRSSRCLACS
jgi:hypothetical protein